MPDDRMTNDNATSSVAALVDIATATQGIVRVKVSGSVGAGYDLKDEQAFVEMLGPRYWERVGADETGPQPPYVRVESVIRLSTEEPMPNSEWDRAEPTLRRALGRASLGPVGDLLRTPDGFGR